MISKRESGVPTLCAMYERMTAFVRMAYISYILWFVTFAWL